MQFSWTAILLQSLLLVGVVYSCKYLVYTVHRVMVHPQKFIGAMLKYLVARNLPLRQN